MLIGNPIVIAAGLLAAGLASSVAPPGRPAPAPGDSVIYRLAPASRLDVVTGKSGLLGFAGHSHIIRARGFSGQVVHYPDAPAQSRVEIRVSTDSLEVLTPPDTAEIRKVTASMRNDVLEVERFPEITLVTKAITPSSDRLHLVALLTIHGQTREVPIEVSVRFAGDTLHASTIFSVKQTEFGVKPYSGGPGGTVKVADRVKFDIAIVALKSESGTGNR
jgi:polyisoprenoid-binding protein YceI